MGRINLDTIRAERMKDKAEHVVTFNGQDFALPPEIPFSVGTFWASGEVVDGLRLLFGDQAYDDFAKGNPSVDDIEALVEALAEDYGLNLGESSASNGSSPSRRRSRSSKPGASPSSFDGAQCFI